MRRSRGGPRSIRRFFLHCHTVDRGRARFKIRRKIAPIFSRSPEIPSILPSVHSRWRSRRPFHPLRLQLKLLPAVLFFFSLSVSRKKRKRSCDFRPVVSIREKERGREKEKERCRSLPKYFGRPFGSGIGP